MEYKASARDEKHRVSVEFDFQDGRRRREIILKVKVLEGDKWIDAKSSGSLKDLLVPKQIDLRGFYKVEGEELQIENVQRGVIDEGQDFLVNSIKMLQELEPNIRHVYLANVVHPQTLKRLKELYSEDLPISSLSREESNPLISALYRCGFRDQKVVLEGAAFYGIRASAE